MIFNGPLAKSMEIGSKLLHCQEDQRKVSSKLSGDVGSLRAWNQEKKPAIAHPQHHQMGSIDM